MSADFQVVPISRLTLRMVRSTLVTAWFLADWPTRTSPFFAKATTDGVVREPSEFAMTVGSPPSRTVTTELVVPRSIPTARAMGMASLPCTGWCRSLVWSARKPVATLRRVHSTFLPRLTAGIATMFPGPRTDFRLGLQSRPATAREGVQRGSRGYQGAFARFVHRLPGMSLLCAPRRRDCGGAPRPASGGRPPLWRVHRGRSSGDGPRALGDPE